MLLGAAGEVEHHALAVHLALAASERDRRPTPRARRSRIADAVGERRDAGAGPPLAVVEHGVGGLPQAAGTEHAPRAPTGAARRRGWRPAARAGRRGAPAAGASRRSARRARPRRAGCGEITTPSSASVRLSAGIDPGSRPPTSAWWARLAANPSSCAAASKTGVMTVMSGRWVPPANGSLRIHETPASRCLLDHGCDAPRASPRGARGCARPASPSARPRRTARWTRRGAP